jgi:hypothetical protein
MKTEEVVKLCKHRQNMAKIEIFAPRYSTREVLIHQLKVKEHNIIALTKANSLNGLYYISGKRVRKGRNDTNGTAPMYAVKLDDLLPFEWEERCIHEY